MKAIKKSENFRLYKIENHFELWLGNYTTDKYSDKGVRLGYVSNPENWEEALENAKEEIACLMVGA
jgi:hypothetical protein